MLNRLLTILFIFFLSSNLYAANRYKNYCKITNPKKGAEYETHTKESMKFCAYYLEICNKKYNNKCKMEMNGYQPLYNTNPTIAKMHILYNEDFDKD